MPFACLPDCGKCCGVVPFSLAHFARVKDRAVTPSYKVDWNRDRRTGALYAFPAADDGRCPFLDRSTKRCVIHDDKPDLCRKFGLSEHPLLSCPWIAPDGRHRSRQDTRRVFRKTTNPMLRLLAVEEACAKT